MSEFSKEETDAVFSPASTSVMISIHPFIIYYPYHIPVKGPLC